MNWKLFNFWKSKRKTPTEIIERVYNPSLESAYIKLPRKNPHNVSSNREPNSVMSDYKKIGKLLKKGGKYFSHIHTHPYFLKSNTPDVLPSLNDLDNFLIHRKHEKTMIIAQQNSETGKVEGYFVMRKTKKTPKGISKDKIEEFEEKYCQRLVDSQKHDSPYPYTAINQIAKKFNLQYRFIPAKRYGFDYFKGLGFVKENKLEDKVTGIISLAGFGLSLIFLSLNITGNVVANLTQNSSNWIGGILFVVGIIAGFFWLRKRKPKVKKIKQNRKRKR